MNGESYRLLLVEDDNQLSAMMVEFLANHHYRVARESNGTEAIRRVQKDDFDVIVLDIGLPGADGFDVCRTIRPTFIGPILVLTARGDEADEVAAFEAGADDFMSKPVRPTALLTRLKIHLRRKDHHRSRQTLPGSDGEILVDDLKIDVGTRSVFLGQDPVDLTTAEFDLLEYLARQAGSVVTRKNLYADLLEIPYDGLDRSVDLRVSRLRKKLGDDPQRPTRIKSVRGVGYLLVKQLA